MKNKLSRILSAILILAFSITLSTPVLAIEDIRENYSTQLKSTNTDPSQRKAVATLPSEPKRMPENGFRKYELFKEQYNANKELRKDLVKDKFTDVQEARVSMIKENAAKAQARILKSTEILSMLTDRIEVKLTEQGNLTTQNQARIDAIRDEIELVETRTENLSSLYDDIENLSADEITTTLAKLKQETRAIIASLKDIKTDLRLLIQETK